MLVYSRKACLVVKGANGVVIDGCEVVPTPGKDTTVPLSNGSEIEIHKKTFRFEYPPKEVRAALLLTPRTAKKSRRSLRMSMIASAKVFTPQKSTPIKMPLRTSGLRGEEEQWEALKSPVKISFEEQETVLIQGTGEDAVVVEEEKDLIILEHVEEQPETIELFSPTLSNSQTTAPKQEKTQVLSLPSQGFKTPPNRRKSGLSLHRAVVLRSAHRAYLEQERQRALEELENEHEEEEVELAISPERDLGPFELCGDARGDNNEVGMPFGEEIYNHVEDEGDDEDEGQDGVNNEELQGTDELEDEIVSNAVQPSSHTSRLYSGPLETIKAGFNIVKKLAYERSPERVPLSMEDEGIKARKAIGADGYSFSKTFMTPQPFSKRAQRVPVDIKPRQTLAGGELVPLFAGARRVPREPRITEEERQAIMERRRSALQTSTMLPPPGPRNNCIGKEEQYIPGQDNEDTETMLEKMKMKLESVRRRSEVRMARLSHVSPHKDIGHSMISSPSWCNEPKSRTLRMAEESLRQMKLEDNDEEQMHEISSPIRQKPLFPHSPRFETVREMTPRLHNEPQTPSFFGMKKMFNTMPSPGTPSFVGIKEMYKTVPVPTTPIMKLDEMFMEAEEPDVGGKSTNSRLPTRKGWGRKRATPAVREVIDVDAQTTQSNKRVVGKVAEPLVEVQNNQNHISARTNVSDDDQEPPMRITRSRGVKPIVDDSKIVKEPIKRATTRQTTKQQTNVATAESTKVRRGRTKQSVEQVKTEDITEAVPKPSTRRKPRLK
ncbi:hypothetical protein Clacol_010515 [Clathrus columnatus]|uniref:FHA domain-containing protein n=1 Tax=Clathrus columnatus TaxID=1419009 RepID=A0AAV5AST9_9AGAM|nr:hypothetical protein Clacol_010515 [Clathrus columnatus]